MTKRVHSDEDLDEELLGLRSTPKEDPKRRRKSPTKEHHNESEFDDGYGPDCIGDEADRQWFV